MNRSSRLVICSLTAIAAVGTLTVLTYFIPKASYGFERVFPPHALGKMNVLPLEPSPYYLVGTTSDQIYFGTFAYGFKLRSTTFSGQATYEHVLKIENKNVLFSAPRMTLCGEHLYLADVGTGKIFTSPIHEKMLREVRRPSLPSFNLFEAFSESFIVLRTYDTSLQQNILVKAGYGHDRGRSYVPEKEKEGVFSTEGRMAYDNRISVLAYVHRYRNLITALDTNLNVVYKVHTIDTVSRSNIEVVDIKKERKLFKEK